MPKSKKRPNLETLKFLKLSDVYYGFGSTIKSIFSNFTAPKGRLLDNLSLIQALRHDNLFDFSFTYRNFSNRLKDFPALPQKVYLMMKTFDDIEATVNVEAVNETQWVLVMTAPKINFEGRANLPDGFPTFRPESQKYWSKRIFKTLEKQLAAQIRNHQRVNSRLKLAVNNARANAAHVPGEE